MGRETARVLPGGQRATQVYDSEGLLTAPGNRRTEVVTRGGLVRSVTSTYDDNDRLLTEVGTAPTVTYTYDAAGQMLTRADSAGTSTFTYDAGHRLVGATTPTATVAYSYDAAGLRQSQTIGGVTTRFVVDPTFTDAQVVAEIVSGGSEAHYTYGLTRLSRHRGGVAAFLHADALGSLRLATDASGAPTERWDYDAFGAIATHVDPAGQPIPATAADAHSFLFAGPLLPPRPPLRPHPRPLHPGRRLPWSGHRTAHAPPLRVRPRQPRDKP